MPERDQWGGSKLFGPGVGGQDRVKAGALP